MSLQITQVAYLVEIRRRSFMKVFKVPFDLKREEKIFGGYLSLRQVTYLMLAASSLALFATPIPKILTIFIVIAITTFFLLCSFLKIPAKHTLVPFPENYPSKNHIRHQPL